MSEEKKSFTVADRRRFTADGDLRQEESVRPPAAEAPAPGPAAPPLQREAEAPSSPVREAADFGGFLMSLGAQASLLLGLGPEGEAEPPDLAGARSIISILEMLKDKTQGRRTPEEEGILDGVLYELRMAYIAKTRGGA
jgi:hypothetical protein